MTSQLLIMKKMSTLSNETIHIMPKCVIISMIMKIK
jgi:hypothetical protein